MEDYDPADLDGNGEFDAIDISIMEDEIGDGKRGCCVTLILIGSSVGTGLWWIGRSLV